MRSDDAIYFEQREAEALRMAEAAATPEARSSHAAMAASYARRKAAAARAASPGVLADQPAPASVIAFRR